MSSESTSTTKAKLLMKGLHERHTGLTASLGGVFFEAACVCFSRHHESPVDVDILRKDGSAIGEVAFEHPGERERNAHANETDATEMGAYGVSLAAVEAVESLIAIRRAETLTGADWYVGPMGTTSEDLETCYRLEVSGTDAGNLSAVEARLVKKVQQARDGRSNLPAIATVVGFKQGVVAIRKVGEPT